MAIFIIFLSFALCASFCAVSKADTEVCGNLQACEHIVVGAGWGGTYFAYRTSLDETSGWDPKSVCIFEATQRVGGRAYSVSGVPGLEDLRLDLGAYRFDTHSHVLVNHVMVNVLKKPTRCYEPGVCNKFGNLTNVKDAYDNDAGYASGPEGLVKLLVENGGQIFHGHLLTKITRSDDPAKPVRLEFENGVDINAASVFLNLPAKSIEHLHKESVIFQEASADTKVALSWPQQFPGAKQFLIYPSAVWRKYEDLQTGSFSDRAAIPPVEGRFYDFTGKCSTPFVDNDCFGAIMTYYAFNNFADLEYFASFQNSTADPYTYIALDASKQDRNYDMIMAAHENFIKAIVSKNITGFNETDKIRNLLPLPTGTVIAVWWARDAASSVNPAPSVWTNTSREYMSDPLHVMRNRVSKPLDDLPIFIGNEAYSGGAGWAEPSLLMTERILWQHFKNKPTWVTNCNDCFYGDASTCVDCASETWWLNQIDSDPLDLNQKLIKNCQAHKGEIVEVVDGKCKVVSVRDNVLAGNAVCTPHFSANGFNITWQWLTSKSIHFHVHAKAKGWIGIGFGKDMSNAQIVAARVVDGQCTIDVYNSTGHVAPSRLPGSAAHAGPLKCSYHEDKGLISMSFSRPLEIPASAFGNSFVNISLNKPTDMIYALYDGLLEGSNLFPQHSAMYQVSLDLQCERHKDVTFVDDIKPLFRQKDRDAMLFALDLYDYNDTKKAAAEIYSHLREKTFLGLPTGMPKDYSWTPVQIHMFHKWMLTDYKVGSIATCTSKIKPNFYGDIKGFFRPKDRNAMLTIIGDFWDYDVVKANYAVIYASLSERKMPCDSQWWTAEQLATFMQWVACGFERGDPSQGAINDREVFYRVLNIEENPEYIPTAKFALDTWLAEAQLAGEPENIEEHFEYRLFVPYDVDTFQTTLMKLYKSLADEGEEYNPRFDSDFTTKEQVVNRILQLAPFNLIDGAWISHCCPTGPIDEVHNLLWGILNDEMGAGEVSQNHCTLYNSLLESVGIFLPPVSTYDFANYPGFNDSAFTQPAYAVALAQFSQEYFPELLGTTLQIEWSVLGLVPGVKLMNYWGIDPHFYELHIGIDNAAKGHGYRAKRAVELFLDEQRLIGGDDAVQKAWRRIWNGFLAFDALGVLSDSITYMNEKLVNTTEEERVVEMMNAKAQFGDMNHRHKSLGKNSINELFGNPNQFVALLRNSAWVVAGNPDSSPLMAYLTSFDGPMFKVFDPAELDIWRNWIFSLRPAAQRAGKLDSYHAMRETVKRVMLTAMDVNNHHLIKLWGPSPNVAADGELVLQSVAHWLSTVPENPDWMMAALKHPKNNLIWCGHSNESMFLTHALMPQSQMGTMFARVASDAAGLDDPKHPSDLWTWTDIVTRWIDDECPMEHVHGHKWRMFGAPSDVEKPRSKKKHSHKGRKYVH